MTSTNETGKTPAEPTAEYPEVADKVGGTRTQSGWRGPDFTSHIGQPVDPRDRPQEPIVVRTGGGAMRGLFWLVATIGLIVAIVLGGQAFNIFPDLKNPFS